MTQANLFEIFSSFQGEGFFAGRRQIFVRFTGCDLHCNYCDTPEAQAESDVCRVEKEPGMGEFEEVPNPLRAEQVSDMIKALATPDLHSVSLTGGEPLHYADFIAELDIPYPIYLETNGNHPEEVVKVADRVKFAAVDIKLPEHNAGEWDKIYKNEVETIDILKYKAFTMAKVVVFDSTTPETIGQIAKDLDEICPPIHLVIQPVTPKGGIQPPDNRALMKLSEAAGEHLQNVQVLPQVHKLMGIK